MTVTVTGSPTSEGVVPGGSTVSSGGNSDDTEPLLVVDVSADMDTSVPLEGGGESDGVSDGVPEVDEEGGVPELDAPDEGTPSAGGGVPGGDDEVGGDPSALLNRPEEVGMGSSEFPNVSVPDAGEPEEPEGRGNSVVTKVSTGVVVWTWVIPPVVRVTRVVMVCREEEMQPISPTCCSPKASRSPRPSRIETRLQVRDSRPAHCLPM